MPENCEGENVYSGDYEKVSNKVLLDINMTHLLKKNQKMLLVEGE